MSAEEGEEEEEGEGEGRGYDAGRRRRSERRTRSHSAWAALVGWAVVALEDERSCVLVAADDEGGWRALGATTSSVEVERRTAGAAGGRVESARMHG